MDKRQQLHTTVVQNSLRSSGIPVLGDMAWGTHFCQFYQTREHLLEILVPYFKAGLESNECCVWVTSEAVTRDEACSALAKVVPDLGQRVSRGQIEIFPYNKWYTAGGFDMNRVLQGWRQKYDEAVGNGFVGLRVSGNTAWLDRKDSDSFSEYEQSVDGAIEGLRMLVLCTYSLDRCSQYELLDVVRTHQFALVLGKRGWERIENAELRRLREMNETLERHAAERTEELARSNKDLEQFAYVVSHDLQEPLRMVTSFMDLLSNRLKGALDVKSREYLNYAVDGADRMSQMIRDLLEYSRVGSKGAKPATVDLNALLAQVQANLLPAIEESQAVITHDQLPTVTADAAQMTQVFQNLIANAIKFRAHHRRAVIHVGVCQDGSQWVFQVEDNGIGIDPIHAHRIFKVFQRLHTRDKYPGSGIGLAICQRIIERYRGRIWVESSPGQGSTFKFTLPASESSPRTIKN